MLLSLIRILLSILAGLESFVLLHRFGIDMRRHLRSISADGASTHSIQRLHGKFFDYE